MTATRVSEAAVEMRAGPQHSRFCQRLRLFSFCSRRKSEVAIQGQLRIQSLPGVFLILGILVVVVGTAVAVAGYWPYHTQRATVEATPVNGTRGAVGRPAGSKSIMSTAALVHSDRMKLLGPIVMGVGLFIFICANTMLYENRDRETQLLLSQAAAVLPEGGPPTLDMVLPQNSQWSVSHPTTELNISCLEELADSVSELLETSSGGAHWAACGQPPLKLFTNTSHQEESSSASAQLHTPHSEYCSSSVINVSTPGSSGGSPPSTPLGTSAVTTLALPLIKVINCPVKTLPSICGDDWTVPAPPRRAYSLSYRTNPWEHLTSVRQVEAVGKATFLPEPLQKEFGSDVYLRTVVLISGESQLDRTLTKQQKHCSWPRLDLSSSRRYLKLEHIEDSGEML